MVAERVADLLEPHAACVSQIKHQGELVPPPEIAWQCLDGRCEKLIRPASRENDLLQIPVHR